ncbi:MAG: DUF1598 domain-containing protein [Thermoguttaceae bacterium]|nr:DUF1598 domain-containing protein [Thermoguttaceae bacterium]
MMRTFLPHSKSRLFGWGVLLIAVVFMTAGTPLFSQNYNRNNSSRNNSSNRSGSRGGSYSGGNYGSGGYGDYEDYGAREYYRWGYRSAVGGFSIDADRVVRTAPTEASQKMAERVRSLLAEIPADLDAPTPLRKISLRRLSAEVRSCLANDRPIPDSILFLGGLTGIDYVAAVPEEHDIYIAGPAEGWTVSETGEIVGKESGKPIFRLEDLLTILRSWNTETPEVITCSIDPTPEGIAAVADLGALATDAEREEAIGLMDVTFTGIPADSRVAAVLAAADYSLKTISLGYETVPIKNFPSYFESIKASGTANYGQRFWISPVYNKIYHGTDSLTWKLSDMGVETLTEREHFAADGSRRAGGKKDVQAARWAANMSKRYDEVAAAVPVFAEAKNCMELALCAAVIYAKHLPEKSGLSLADLTDEAVFPASPLPAPAKVPGFSLSRQIGGKAAVSVTGGISINPWEAVQNGTALDAELDAVSLAFAGEKWYAN